MPCCNISVWAHTIVPTGCRACYRICVGWRKAWIHRI